jgi:hypothetical protein
MALVETPLDQYEQLAYGETGDAAQQLPRSSARKWIK